MEKSITELDFQRIIDGALDLETLPVNGFSPLVLAYIGDCIFDLIIKSMIIQEGNRPVQQLHERASYFLNAAAQSQMMRAIQEHLTEAESGYYRRGRNAKSVSPPKNQSITDYRRATGFEALLGYLYLEKQYQRILTLVKIGLESMKEHQVDDK